MKKLFTARRVIALTLVMALSMAFCMSASAYQTLWQEGVLSPGYTGQTFTTAEDETKITISVVSSIISGSSTTINIRLQKQGIFGIWSDVSGSKKTINVNSEPENPWIGFDISKNSTYRVVAELSDGGMATIGTAIILYS